MKKLIFCLTLISSVQAFAALPSSLTCQSIDPNDPVNPNGTVTIKFNPFSVVNQKLGQTNMKVYYTGSVVCGRDSSNINPAPACSLNDQSAQGALQVGHDCNQDFGNGNLRWYSVSNLIVTEKGTGQFDCKLKYPSSDLKLLLSNCVSQ